MKSLCVVTIGPIPNNVEDFEQRSRVYNTVYIARSVITRLFPVDPDNRVIMELQCIFYSLSQPCKFK